MNTLSLMNQISLTQLFNKILDSGIILKSWKLSSDIILFFKKGNTHQMGNYTPISLSTIISEFFSEINRDKYKKFFESTTKWDLEKTAPH